MNQAIVAGNVGQDPEVREAGGKLVAKFSIATRDGKDKQTWHRIVVWEKLAETVRDYVSKGSFIVVSGRIQNGSYDKEVGGETIKIPTSEIVAGTITLGPRRESAPADEAF